MGDSSNIELKLDHAVMSPDSENRVRADRDVKDARWFLPDGFTMMSRDTRTLTFRAAWDAGGIYRIILVTKDSDAPWAVAEVHVHRGRTTVSGGPPTDGLCLVDVAPRILLHAPVAANQAYRARQHIAIDGGGSPDDWSARVRVSGIVQDGISNRRHKLGLRTSQGLGVDRDSIRVDDEGSFSVDAKLSQMGAVWIEFRTEGGTNSQATLRLGGYVAIDEDSLDRIQSLEHERRRLHQELEDALNAMEVASLSTVDAIFTRPAVIAEQLGEVEREAAHVFENGLYVTWSTTHFPNDRIPEPPRLQLPGRLDGRMLGKEATIGRTRLSLIEPPILRQGAVFYDTEPFLLSDGPVRHSRLPVVVARSPLHDPLKGRFAGIDYQFAAYRLIVNGPKLTFMSRDSDDDSNQHRALPVELAVTSEGSGYPTDLKWIVAATPQVDAGQVAPPPSVVVSDRGWRCEFCPSIPGRYVLQIVSATGSQICGSFEIEAIEIAIRAQPRDAELVAGARDRWWIRADHRALVVHSDVTLTSDAPLTDEDLANRQIGFQVKWLGKESSGKRHGAGWLRIPTPTEAGSLVKFTARVVALVVAEQEVDVTPLQIDSNELTVEIRPGRVARAEASIRSPLGQHATSAQLVAGDARHASPPGLADMPCVEFVAGDVRPILCDVAFEDAFGNAISSGTAVEFDAIGNLAVETRHALTDDRGQAHLQLLPAKNARRPMFVRVQPGERHFWIGLRPVIPTVTLTSVSDSARLQDSSIQIQSGDGRATLRGRVAYTDVGVPNVSVRVLTTSGSVRGGDVWAPTLIARSGPTGEFEFQLSSVPLTARSAPNPLQLCDDDREGILCVAAEDCAGKSYRVSFAQRKPATPVLCDDKWLFVQRDLEFAGRTRPLGNSRKIRVTADPQRVIWAEVQTQDGSADFVASAKFRFDVSDSTAHPDVPSLIGSDVNETPKFSDGVPASSGPDTVGPSTMDQKYCRIVDFVSPVSDRSLKIEPLVDTYLEPNARYGTRLTGLPGFRVSLWLLIGKSPNWEIVSIRGRDGSQLDLVYESEKHGRLRVDYRVPSIETRGTQVRDLETSFPRGRWRHVELMLLPSLRDGQVVISLRVRRGYRDPPTLEAESQQTIAGFAIMASDTYVLSLGPPQASEDPRRDAGYIAELSYDTPVWRCSWTDGLTGRMTPWLRFQTNETARAALRLTTRLAERASTSTFTSPLADFAILSLAYEDRVGTVENRPVLAVDEHILNLIRRITSFLERHLLGSDSSYDAETLAAGIVGWGDPTQSALLLLQLGFNAEPLPISGWLELLEIVRDSLGGDRSLLVAIVDLNRLLLEFLADYESTTAEFWASSVRAGLVLTVVQRPRDLAFADRQPTEDLSRSIGRELHTLLLDDVEQEELRELAEFAEMVHLEGSQAVDRIVDTAEGTIRMFAARFRLLRWFLDQGATPGQLAAFVDGVESLRNRIRSLFDSEADFEEDHLIWQLLDRQHAWTSRLRLKAGLAPPDLGNREVS